MKVLFAPDWREANPYQRQLANALNRLDGCEVHFAKGYRRILPIARMVRSEKPDLLHLHWPEAYCPSFGALGKWRIRRLPLDLWLARLSAPYVITAHNLWPHQLPHTASLRLALRHAYQNARAVIAHSAVAADQVAAQWGVPRSRFHIIPHGDTAAELDKTPPSAAPEGVLCFGRLVPYKGIEPLILWWKQHRPFARLSIVGAADSDEYLRSLQQLIANDPLIRLIPKHVSDNELAAHILSARAVVLNHHAGLTSGVASLARSLGTNILLPHRLAAVDLMEPHPSVFRFDTLDTDFAQILKQALNRPRQPIDHDWLRAISWQSIAGATLACYRRALSGA